MASLGDEYYDGSRLFISVSEYTGVSIDQVNFVISQFVALALASLYRNVLHTSKTRSAIRQVFGLTGGLIIGYFCFGSQAIHLAGLPALCYIVIRSTNPEIMQRIVLVVALTYLSCIHLHRQVFDYGSHCLDITGPLMVMTQKVTSLAFCLHDGLCRAERELTVTQKTYAVKKVPTPLEYFSYMLQFPTIIAGPVLFYKDYMDFINGTNFPPPLTNKLNKTGNGSTVVLEPSPTRAVLQKLGCSIIFAFVYVQFLPMFSISRVKEDGFLEKTSLLYKLWYLYLAGTPFRFKYYFAWMMADAVCNNAGLGFSGTNPDGSTNWDRFSNVNIRQFEFGTNLKETLAGWNIGTNLWLRMVVYDRVDKHATILTFALSALWHGFYPGYYLTFSCGALFTLAARKMRRTLRDHFTGNVEWKFAYDVSSTMLTRMTMGYMTSTFILLEFWPSIRLYLHMYLCFHWLALAVLFVLPRVVPPAQPGSSKHLTGTGSIAHVLKQAGPITNSVSNHHI